MDERRLQTLIDEFRDHIVVRVKEEGRSSPFLNLDDRRAVGLARCREEGAEKVLKEYILGHA